MAGVAAFTGWSVGLIRMAMSLVGTVLAIVLASRLFDNAAPVFNGITDNDEAARILGFILVFLLVMAAAFIAGVMLKQMVKFFLLGPLDSLGGMVVGALLSMAAMAALLSLVEQNTVLGLNDTINDSMLGGFLVDEFDVALEKIKIMPGDLSERAGQLGG
jgi:uncharacterized membrane protein required for colicin V production